MNQVSSNLFPPFQYFFFIWGLGFWFGGFGPPPIFCCSVAASSSLTDSLFYLSPNLGFRLVWWIQKSIPAKAFWCSEKRVVLFGVWFEKMVIWAFAFFLNFVSFPLLDYWWNFTPLLSVYVFYCSDFLLSENSVGLWVRTQKVYGSLAVAGNLRIKWLRMVFWFTAHLFFLLQQNWLWLCMLMVPLAIDELHCLTSIAITLPSWCSLFDDSVITMWLAVIDIL